MTVVASVLVTVENVYVLVGVAEPRKEVQNGDGRGVVFEAD